MSNRGCVDVRSKYKDRQRQCTRWGSDIIVTSFDSFVLPSFQGRGVAGAYPSCQRCATLWTGCPLIEGGLPI